MERRQNQVYRRVAEVAEKDLSSDPIGRRRLDQKLLPFDHKTGTLRRLYKLLRALSLGVTEAFLFGGFSPPNKKSVSPRPLRLCVENPTLDKRDNFPLTTQNIVIAFHINRVPYPD